MRLEGTLVELRSADLACEQAEALELLELTSGRDIGPGQADGLVARTGGWVAGLQLAALSLANVTDIDVFIEQFAGDDRVVVDYLSGRILRDLDEHTRSFLLRTSVLDWLTPSLCTAVTDDEDARSTLNTLVDHSHFLTRTGGGGDRFRHHPLFADLLRYQLAAQDPAAEVECRTRAASWLLDHHEYTAGVEQLLAAGDHEAAFEVLAAEGHHLFIIGEIATLLRLLTQVHHSYPGPPPEVSIHLLAAQVAADEFTAAAENYRQLRLRSDLTPGEHVAADSIVLSLGYSRLPPSEMRRLADGVLRSLREIERSSVPDVLGIGGADACETIARRLGSVRARPARTHRARLRAAVVTQQEGNAGMAGTLAAEVARQADAEGLLGPFLEVPLALSLLRTAAPARRLPRVRRLLESRWSTEVRHGSDQLVEQLTAREMVVLEYLPTRLGNEEIAQTLYVSVNTLKTHLRNIYRKLGTPGRDAAVERATSLGLI